MGTFSALAMAVSVACEEEICPFSIFEIMPGENPGGGGEFGAGDVEPLAVLADLRADGLLDGEADDARLARWRRHSGDAGARSRWPRR